MTTSSADTPISSLSLNEHQVSNAFSTVSFAVEIPQELMGLPDMNLTQNGVVGTITFLKNSAMVWIGWGSLIDSDGEKIINGNGSPRMGPMTVAMPRTRYSGMGSGGNEAPSSQLIGGDNEEEVMMGNSMAGRLAKKTGWPVFVSCSLGEMGNVRNGSGGMDELQGNAFGDNDLGSLAVHAAALAEKEAGKLILQRQKEL